MASSSSSSPAPVGTVTPSPSAPATSFPDGPAPTPTYTEPPSKPDPEPTAPPSGTATIQILNTRWDPSAGTVRVDAMVTDRVSSTGVCTVGLSQGSQSASAQVAGEPDAKVTYCANMVATMPPGAAGTWSVTVVFEDVSSKGTATGEVTLQ
ncbi:hypothetical protein DVJ78_08020 [Humibacter sp. BT305]|nr:hypothetical protein DVJ78_08020 [Humibacter sp. BT305]